MVAISTCFGLDTSKIAREFNFLWGAETIFNLKNGQLIGWEREDLWRQQIWVGDETTHRGRHRGTDRRGHTRTLDER